MAWNSVRGNRAVGSGLTCGHLAAVMGLWCAVMACDAGGAGVRVAPSLTDETGAADAGVNPWDAGTVDVLPGEPHVLAGDGTVLDAALVGTAGGYVAVWSSVVENTWTLRMRALGADGAPTADAAVLWTLTQRDATWPRFSPADLLVGNTGLGLLLRQDEARWWAHVVLFAEDGAVLQRRQEPIRGWGGAVMVKTPSGLRLVLAPETGPAETPTLETRELESAQPDGMLFNGYGDLRAAVMAGNHLVLVMRHGGGHGTALYQLVVDPDQALRTREVELLGYGDDANIFVDSVVRAVWDGTEVHVVWHTVNWGDEAVRSNLRVSRVAVTEDAAALTAQRDTLATGTAWGQLRGDAAMVRGERVVAWAGALPGEDNRLFDAHVRVKSGMSPAECGVQAQRALEGADVPALAVAASASGSASGAGVLWAEPVALVAPSGALSPVHRVLFRVQPPELCATRR